MVISLAFKESKREFYAASIVAGMSGTSKQAVE
jgi:hypothetical protein